MHSVTIDGQTRQFVIEGYLFIHFADERVVVSTDRRFTPTGEVIAVTIRSSGNPTTFGKSWSDHARLHCYLRGRAFYADGEIIERKHRYCWDDIILQEENRQLIRTHVEGFLNNRKELATLGVKSAVA